MIMQITLRNTCFAGLVGLLLLCSACNPNEETNVVAENDTIAKIDADSDPAPAADPDAVPVDDAVASPDGPSAAESDPMPEETQAVGADRALPDPPDASQADPPTWEPEGPTPADVARAAFEPPPASKSLSKSGRLWVDLKKKRVYVDGYVAMKQGPLEMFACPVGTKEHESVVAVVAHSREVHAALLAIGAASGTPVKFQPEFVPPTGQVIRVWVCWYDAEGTFHAVDGRQWVQDQESQKPLEAEWVFAGSSFWQDPEDKREFYQADSGDMICVSNFASAMLDVSIASSADSESLRFVPFESKIPDRATPVRLVLSPVPFPTDADNEVQEPKPPAASDVVPNKKTASSTSAL